MYYVNGNYSMGGNFKIKKQAPMDDRSTVAKKIDLQNPNLFDGFTYNGMIVSVVDDTVNNGIYRLEDKTTKTWVKEGGSSTGGGTTGDYNTLINKPVFKTVNNNSLLGEGNIAIDPVMNNNGIFIKKSYADINSFNEKKNLTTWEESDVVYIGEYIDPGIKPTCYLSPTGSDTTGDGSYNNPWKTFTKVPKSSIVGLKAGEYRTSDYGRIVTNSGYNETHGLFTGLAFNTIGGIVRPFNPSPTVLPTNLKALLSKQSTGFESYTEALLIVKENEGVEVKIIWDTITPSLSRDKNIFTSYMGGADELIIVKGITFIRNTDTGLANYSSAISELTYHQKGILIEDCAFDFGGSTYSYIYGGTGVPIYNRCDFINGTLVSSYSGSSKVLTDNTIDVDDHFLERILPGYRIYNSDVNDFIPFAFLKDGITTSTYTFEGLSEIPSPKLGIETKTAMRHPISGKPIYVKTIDCGFLPATKTAKVIPLNITDDYDYVKVLTDASHIVIPNIKDFSFSVLMPWYTLESQIGAYIEANSVVIGVGMGQSNKKAYVTVEYTKTADTSTTPAALIGGKGIDGKSAYQSAVDNGYVGTEAQWVEDMKGARGLPGQPGVDGTVAFESLTEAQLEMLLVNRNIVTRRSTNLLLQNLTVNSCLLDISSKMSLPEKIEVTTNEDAVYTIENLKLANPLVSIGDCKYTNVSNDLQFDIFADNSPLLAYPLQTNSNDLGGLYNGVDTGVTYANNKAVFNGAAKITPPAFTVPTEMTVSFYVTFTELGSFMIFDFGGGKAIYMYQDNRIRAQYSNANNAHKSTTSAMVVGREYFVTAVIKASSADIYIDGELQINTAWANYVTSTALCIGAKSNNTMFSKMTLSMLRIFKRALTASEILHMYQTRTIEMLELYHASGVNLKNSKIIQRTVSLTAPRYLNEAEAIKYGLTAGDMYYLTDGSVKFVKGL